MTARLPAIQDDLLPLPRHQFQLFLFFLNLIYLGGLALVTGVSLWSHWGNLGWQQVVIIGTVIVQTALHLATFVFNSRWPLPLRWLVAYFAGSVGLWLIEWQLEPNFRWLVGSYVGLMYSMLPIPISIPTTSLVFLAVVAEDIGWDRLGQVTTYEVLGIITPLVAMIILSLYIYHLLRTSGERARLIAELQAAQHELELARQRDAENAALLERERLARDMHDGLGHTLAALSVQLEAIQRLYPVDPERASTQVDDMKSLTRASMDSLRRSLAGLRTPGLGERTLGQSLKMLSEETRQRAGLDIECHLAPAADTLAPSVAETLWRVAQEALTNVEKHAQASRADIYLEVKPQAAILRIVDDGQGLPANALNRKGHYGLLGMRERVEGLGGVLAIARNGERGTLIEAQLPVIGS
jgi:signal transduction histidine kinase